MKNMQKITSYFVYVSCPIYFCTDCAEYSIVASEYEVLGYLNFQESFSKQKFNKEFDVVNFQFL